MKGRWISLVSLHRTFAMSSPPQLSPELAGCSLWCAGRSRYATPPDPHLRRLSVHVTGLHPEVEPHCAAADARACCPGDWPVLGRCD